MPLKNKNWITFTPKAFRGDEKTFFSRDSGLCCRALQSLGAEAKVVMPEPVWDDEPDVLRVPYDQLKDVAFWKEQGADAVISYSWANPRYTPIVKAIKFAGLKLFVNMDTDGLISPFVEPWEYVRILWRTEQLKRGACLGALIAFCRLGWQCIGLHKHFSRLRHMDCADAIGVVSPIAAERVRKYVRLFGRDDIARKIQFIPHPVDQAMQYTGDPKQERVVAIGRWNDSVQKRPEVLIPVAEKILSENPVVQMAIVGQGAAKLASDIAAGTPQYKTRVTGHERMDHSELCRLMSCSQISLCTSRYESFHIASGEALLCGCSVVSSRTVEMPSFPYFVDQNRSGRLAENSAEALAEAVLAELAVWKNGERDPAVIAKTWRARIAADAVAQQIDTLLS